MAPTVQEVFKVQGVPTYTFVQPSCFTALKVALATLGRGVVIEGPSGIGKSTGVARALEDLGGKVTATKLSARDPRDVEYISLLPDMKSFGVVIVDDFHRLPEEDKHRLADLMKTLADREDEESKLIVIGINEAGRSLIEFAPDLANRIETLRFEVEPPQMVDALVRQGEAALSATFNAREQIVDTAHGSFYIAQLLCLEMCIASGVLEACHPACVIDTSLTAVVQKVMDKQDTRFGKVVRNFVRGTKFRPSGRAPYLHILSWLRDADTWSISLTDELARHATERISVGQVVDKGYLASLIDSQGIESILHFDPATRVLSVEDPHLVFYLRNLDWSKFIRDSGFTKVDFEQVYDIALSFAGEDREYAEHLSDYVADQGYAVFYDLAEQHRILSRNVEEFLGPIYESGARYVVAVLGEQYGVKRWTLFESDKFKHRIDQGEVVPIWSSAVPPSAFDEIRKIGSLMFDPSGDLEMQARHAADVIAKMLAERDSGQLQFAEPAGRAEL